jgi:uncharacterized repeat protein (TIGR02543 family)
MWKVVILFSTSLVCFGDGNSSRRSIISVSAGWAHSLFLKSDGTLWVTGHCENNTFKDWTGVRPINSPLQADSNVSMLASGPGGQIMYLKNSGELWTGGDNQKGQLGSGFTSSYEIPAQVDSNVTMVARGWHHNLFVKSDGTLWGMGDNSHQMFGVGTGRQQITPAPVVNSDGSFVGDVEAIAAGQSHSLFVKISGTLWGIGYSIGLGTGDADNRPKYYNDPVQITDSNGSPWSDVDAVSAGKNHSLFVKSDGTLWAMGKNEYGQLGDGTLIQRTKAVQVVGPNGAPVNGVRSVSAGYDHSLFIKEDGTLWGMGWNYHGQLGNGSTQTANPTPFQIASNVTIASGGGWYSLFAKSDGSLWAMGNNGGGSLGDGTYTNRLSPVQVVAPYIYSKFSITAIASSGGSVIGGGEFGEDDSVTLTAIPDSGYLFVGWSGGVTSPTNPVTFAATSDLNVTANFTQSKDAVLANPNAFGLYTGVDLNASVLAATTAGKALGREEVKSSPGTYGLHSQADLNASVAGSVQQGKDAVLANPNAFGLHTGTDLNASVLAATIAGKVAGRAEVSSSPAAYGLIGMAEHNASVQSATIAGKAAGRAEVTSSPLAFGLHPPSDVNASVASAVEQGKQAVLSNPDAFDLFTSTDLNSSVLAATTASKVAGRAEVIASPTAYGLLSQGDLNSTVAAVNSVHQQELIRVANQSKLEGVASVKADPSAHGFVSLEVMQSIGATPHTFDWYYQPEWGWMWTNEKTFPYVYRTGTKGKAAGWLYFREGSAAPIYFYSYAAQKWVTLEKPTEAEILKSIFD